MNDLRIKRFLFYEQVFLEMFTQGAVIQAHRIKEHGFPLDAKIHDIKYNRSNRMIEVFIESKTFDSLDEDAIVAETVSP